MGNSNLLWVEDLTSRKINIKKSPYLVQTIAKNKLDEYELDGWEKVPSKLKKSIRVRKPKKHNVAFEDRVWALCAKMGFEHINSDDSFTLKYEKGLTKQIDVFAFDSETILIIECKSTKHRKKVGYQQYINEYIALKSKLRLAARKIAGGKQKVAFLFCTNNSVLSDNDRLRLKNGSIFHFNQDVIEYYEQLTEHLGKASKYQLFGHLFSGQQIPELKNRIPAIKGKVSAGHTIYSFLIDPEYLLKIGFILHRTDSNPETIHSYQRLVKKTRLSQIAKFIEMGGYFPNSIIINIQTKSKKDLNFELSSKISHDGSNSIGILHLPKNYRSAFIIDGQHRLFGYSKSKSKSNHTVPVVAFHNLPTEEQAKIFVDVNHNQKSVPANLLQSIMADFHWGSENDRQALSALKTRLFTEMNSDDNSPFYKRVILAEEKKTDIRCLTIQTLKTWGLNRVKYFGKLKGNELVQMGYLQETSHEKTLKKSKLFFNYCFSHIEAHLTEQWARGSAEYGFIAMNIGVSAVIRILDDILDYLVFHMEINPSNLTGEQLAEKTIDYIDPFIYFIQQLDFEGLKKLRGFYGSGATEKIQREFQQAIHIEFPDFNPKGLDRWVRDNTGQFDTEAHDLGHNQIEPRIDKFIKKTLKVAFGTNDDKWWIDGVPIIVQKKCSDRKIEQGSTEPAWNYLTTIDYDLIIKNNWTLFGNYFTPPGKENESKTKRMSWLNDFNVIRQKYVHPQRESISENELNSLKELKRWLLEKI